MAQSVKQLPLAQVIDEGMEGKLRTKQKLTPCSLLWDVCNIPQALLAALKDKETVLTTYSPLTSP